MIAYAYASAIIFLEAPFLSSDRKGPREISRSASDPRVYLWIVFLGVQIWCLDQMILNLLLDLKAIQILEDGSDATEPWGSECLWEALRSLRSGLLGFLAPCGHLDGEMALRGALRRFMNGRPEAACMSSRKKFDHSSSTGTLIADEKIRLLHSIRQERRTLFRVITHHKANFVLSPTVVNIFRVITHKSALSCFYTPSGSGLLINSNR